MKSRTGSRCDCLWRWMRRPFVFSAAGLLLASGPVLPGDTGDINLSITSSAFQQGGEIPSIYTCEGQGISPALHWSGAPEGTHSLVLIVDDPDAPDPANPRMTWVHWVLYNLPPDSDGLAAGVAPGDLPLGTGEGINDWRRTGYGGPCPPVGSHRYFHKLFALDKRLEGLTRPSKRQVERAMKDHVIGQAELIGTYIKRGR